MSWNKKEVVEGEVYGELTVICEGDPYVYPSGKTRRQLLCQCSCGISPKEYHIDRLIKGEILSCGCIKKERPIIHGMHKSRPYKIWRGMKSRCDDPKNNNYEYYGGRGIKYNYSWKFFKSFWEEMQEGYQDHLTLDRINNDLGYSKENCRWVEMSVQMHNRRKRKTSQNKYIGIRKEGKSFSAKIQQGERIVGLGSYDSELSAAKAYDDASEIIYFDRPNQTEKIEDEIFKKVQQRLDSKEGTNLNYRLTDDQVLEIYKLTQEKRLTQKEIADKFGVTDSTVCRIKLGKTRSKVTKEIKQTLDAFPQSCILHTEIIQGE